MPITKQSSSATAGDIKPWPGTTAPAGWLKANGAAISRTLYAALFNVIGTTYGTGDGSTTFNLPDFRGEFLRGLDDGRGVDSGRSLASWQADQNQAHRHTLYYQRGATTNTNNNYFQDGQNYAFEQSTGANRTALLSIDVVGGNESRPRNQALLYVIKF